MNQQDIIYEEIYRIANEDELLQFWKSIHQSNVSFAYKTVGFPKTLKVIHDGRNDRATVREL